MPVSDALNQSAFKNIHTTQNEREIIWASLKELSSKMQQRSLASLFAQSPERGQTFALKTNSLYLDFSKNHIDEDVLETLLALASSCDLKGAIDRLMSGATVNVSENRPALHTALRMPADETLMVDGKNIMTDICDARKKITDFVEKLQSGRWLGATQMPITDVVNIGIGGSDLGPQMVSQALQSEWDSSIKVHFVANIDPIQFETVIKSLNPETTLFLISSKSFTTSETHSNAELAKQWLTSKLHAKQLSQHFIAITANPARAMAWGVAKDHILPFWAWVGGRFSIWSSIGFPVALLLGMDGFNRFLQGAHDMDLHFREAPFSKNMPVIMALIGIWYRNFWQAPTHAICPYSFSLRRFADYIQQLDMESNGKSLKANGDDVRVDTAPIIWGGEGTNAQHAFFQLLHQGCHLIPVDFIVAQESASTQTVVHQQLVINCIAQAKALMEGDDKLYKGNKPSNVLMLNKIDAYAIGQLIALYEHKVFVQGIIWEINSFDQPGVELGKKLANELTEVLQGNQQNQSLDSSTLQLLEKVSTVQSRCSE